LHSEYGTKRGADRQNGGIFAEAIRHHCAMTERAVVQAVERRAMTVADAA
jgi:hypothetical protein